MKIMALAKDRLATQSSSMDPSLGARRGPFRCTYMVMPGLRKCGPLNRYVDRMTSMRDEPKPPQKVSCLCGGTVKVDPLKQDRRVTCPDCRKSFDFVVTVDAGRKKSMISLVLPRSAMKTEGESLANLGDHPSAAPPPEVAFAEVEPPPAPTRPPKMEPVPGSKSPSRITRVGKKKSSGRTIAGIPMATCECGAVFPLDDNGELTTLQS